MNAKRLLAIPFLITAVIYSLALYQSIQAYEEWKKVKLEEYPPDIRPYVDFYPYTSSKQGQQMIILGIIIFLGWLIAIIFLGPALSGWKTSKRTEELPIQISSFNEY